VFHISYIFKVHAILSFFSHFCCCFMHKSLTEFSKLSICFLKIILKIQKLTMATCPLFRILDICHFSITYKSVLYLEVNF
jgi:hypothetical protein